MRSRERAVGSVDLRTAIHDVLTPGPHFSRPRFLPLSEEQSSEELRSCRGDPFPSERR
jgi:hypothetical protein